MERTTLFSLLLVAAAGCADGAAPPVLVGPSLSAPLEMTAAMATSESAVSFDVSSWKDDSSVHLSLTPSELKLVLRTGEHGQITGLELPLGDEDVSADSLPPNGIKLRTLSLGLDASADLTTQFASDNFIELHASAPLRLAWSVELADGTLYALGPALTVPLSFDVEVERDGTNFTARLYARCDGTCWTIDGLARIADGQVHLVAPATIRPL